MRQNQYAHHKRRFSKRSSSILSGEGFDEGERGESLFQTAQAPLEREFLKSGSNHLPSINFLTQHSGFKIRLSRSHVTLFIDQHPDQEPSTGSTARESLCRLIMEALLL
jgi:hypothetical protein